MSFLDASKPIFVLDNITVTHLFLQSRIKWSNCASNVNTYTKLKVLGKSAGPSAAGSSVVCVLGVCFVDWVGCLTFLNPFRPDAHLHVCRGAEVHMMQ